MDSDRKVTVLHYFDQSDPDFWLPPGCRRHSGCRWQPIRHDTTGGANNVGTVFKMDSAGNILCHHDIDQNAGETVSPCRTHPGRSERPLYGTASGGFGTNSFGNVFHMDSSCNFNVIHNFDPDSNEGNGPMAGLIVNGGSLYGKTQYGGAQGYGTVFKMDVNGNILCQLISALTMARNPWPASSRTVRATSTARPSRQQLPAPATVFKVVGGSSCSGGLTVIPHRTRLCRGRWREPPSQPRLDNIGNLYGTTPRRRERHRHRVQDGPHQRRRHFSTPSTFGDSGVATPPASSWPATAVYGTTSDGGPVRQGVIFRLSPETFSRAVEHLQSLNAIRDDPGIPQGETDWRDVPLRPVLFHYRRHQPRGPGYGHNHLPQTVPASSQQWRPTVTPWTLVPPVVTLGDDGLDSNDGADNVLTSR